MTDGIELAQQMRTSRFNRMTPLFLLIDDQRPSALAVGFAAWLPARSFAFLRGTPMGIRLDQLALPDSETLQEFLALDSR
jgi:hypothetical protein